MTRRFNPSASFWEATRIALDSLAQEQAAQLPDAARHHPGHHHADRRHRADPRHGPLHRRQGLQHGRRRLPHRAHGLVRHWDPKKFFEMQKRNPQIQPDEYEFVQEKSRLIRKTSA